jgi:tellurite resistance protein
MATKTTLQGILGRHTEVVEEFRRRLAEVQSERGVPSDTIVREKTRLLAAVEGQIEDARRTRDATVARLDARLTGLDQRAQALKAEIESDRAALDPRGGGKARPGVPGLGRPSAGGRPQAGKAAAKPGKAPSVSAIKGVGKAYGDRLEAAGVRTAAQVAKMKPAKVAEALGISEERAEAMVAAARKVKGKR